MSSARQKTAATTTMTTTMTRGKKKNPLQHLVAGGVAGFVESSICHPLDTIKTRMQLRRQEATIETAVAKARSSLVEPALRIRHSLMEPLSAARSSNGESLLYHSHLHEPSLRMETTKTVPRPSSHSSVVSASLGPFGTARRIVQREGFVALYKGLSAVYTGIIPKMAIRFLSFEQYKELFGGTGNSTVFMAGLMSGLTEAVLIVTPAEVCKIRLQSQYHSMIDPSQVHRRKYTNVVQTATRIVKEEGIGALYKGVIPTMLRQGCNQAVNFTAYQYFKKRVLQYKETSELLPWESLLLGGLSGGIGPLINNPLDVVKTRIQKQVVSTNRTAKYTGLIQGCVTISKEEGVLALWKGVVPRLLRIMPGQAITFMTYEAVNSFLLREGVF